MAFGEVVSRRCTWMLGCSTHKFPPSGAPASPTAIESMKQRRSVLTSNAFERYRTLNFHSLGVLCYWGHCQAYHDLLPTASLPSSRQVGIPVQLYSLLASIPNCLLSSAVGNSVHQTRCPLFSWTRRQIDSPWPCRPNQRGAIAPHVNN